MKKIFVIFLLLFLFFGCVQQNSEDNLQKENNLPVEVEKFGGELTVIGVIDSNPLGQFASDLQEAESSVFNYELRRCTYTEQSPYRDINQPMVSIHSLDETPERNKPLVVVYEDVDEYIETRYVPVTQVLVTNKTDKKTGRIVFELDAEIQGDLFVAYPEIVSFGSVITKSPGISRLDEYYAFLSSQKHYFYDQNENLAFVDTNRVLNNETPLREREVSLNDFYNVNFLSLCNGSLDYVVVDDYGDGEEKQVPCKHAFKRFEIDDVEPNEVLLISVYYYPYARVSFEERYPLAPNSLWPLREQQDGNVLITVSAKYPGEEKELVQVRLKLDLKEYVYDTREDYCIVN